VNDLRAASEKRLFRTDVHDLVQQLAESDAALAALEHAYEIKNQPSQLSPPLLAQIQKTLIQSKDLLEKTLSSMQVGVAYLDLDLKYLWVNPAFAKARGCTADDYTGQSCFDLPPSVEDEELFRQVLQTGEAVIIQTEAFRDSDRSPELRYRDRSIQAVYGSEGVIGLVYTESEVTDRVRFEESLKQQNRYENGREDVSTITGSMYQALLLELFEADPAGLAVVAGSDYVFQFANLKFRSLMPKPEIDPVGLPLREAWPEDEILYPILKSLPDTEAAFDVEDQEHRQPDGSLSWSNFHIRRLHAYTQPAFMINAWDFTQNHLARRAIEASAVEARRRAEELNAVISAMAEAITIYDKAGNPVLVNPATIAAYGFDPITTPKEEAVQRLNIRRLSGEAVAADQLPSAHALQGKRIHQERFLFTDAQKEEQIIIASASPLYIDQELTGAVTVWTNVSGQERLLRQIKLERTRLSTLIANAPVGIVAIDRAGHLLVANSMLDEWWSSTSPAEVLPSHQAMLADGTPFNLMDLTKPAMNGRTQVNQEILLNRPNGESQYLLVNSAPIVNAKGEIEGAVAVIQDITEQKTAQQHLREAKERFVVALKNSPISVYTTDRELRYTWIYNAHSESGHNQIGLRDDELPGASDVEDLMMFKRAVLESETGQRREIRSVFNEVEYYFDVTAEPLRDEDGNISGLTVAAVDITEQQQVKDEMAKNVARIEVQRRLIQQRELERQQIARDLHDGPLQELIGLNFGLEEMFGMKPGQQRKYKEDVIRGAIQEITHELRTFCGVLRPPSLAPFGLEKAIRSHLESFQEKYPTVQVHLELAVDKELLSEDVRMALYRIYQELMNNIVKHAAARSVWVRFEFNEYQIELEVRDNGTGFSVPTNWVETARQGHLGLVGILERAEAVGGFVNITSEPGLGTNVLVIVPNQHNKHDEY
jgi:PAS domain S-box-containing protein